jgi:hypothetical protein
VRVPTTPITLLNSKGTDEHCHMGAMSRVHPEMFGWLDRAPETVVRAEVSA